MDAEEAEAKQALPQAKPLKSEAATMRADHDTNSPTP
jgi:hypothetical protein